MFVRLAFSVQAHLSPDILIVDEALAVGDIFFQQKCAAFMRDQLSNCTKVLVTHDMHAVYNFCSRVIVIENGRIVFDGDTRRGIEAYLRSNHSDIFKDPTLKKVGSNALLSQPDGNNIEFSHPISNDNMGGRGGVKFSAFSVLVNGEPCKNSSASVFSDDRIEIVMNFTASEALEELIFGYLIVDRNGMYVCGDNTHSLNRYFAIGPNKGDSAAISFQWPAIANGSYTVTLGIGRGKDPLNHVIECWAHSVFAFESISHTPIHGLFTNPITDVHVKENSR
jgi:hypothetical protein